MTDLTDLRSEQEVSAQALGVPRSLGLEAPRREYLHAGPQEVRLPFCEPFLILSISFLLLLLQITANVMA